MKAGTKQDVLDVFRFLCHDVSLLACCCRLRLASFKTRIFRDRPGFLGTKRSNESSLVSERASQSSSVRRQEVVVLVRRFRSFQRGNGTDLVLIWNRLL